jgi:hypothetical protein
MPEPFGRPDVSSGRQDAEAVMKLFTCQNCGQTVHFENDRCERCRLGLGFIAGQTEISALDTSNGVLLALADARPYRHCANHALGACNWLVPAGCESVYCPACELNLVVPDLSDDRQRQAWWALEEAKRRLVYSLLRLGLPLEPRRGEAGLGFRFLADGPGDRDGVRVLTGHDNGVITINIEEADPVTREAARRSMGEDYRTLLGHFRHEIGHYYWDVLVAHDTDRLEQCRALFGDERVDYAGALQRHHNDGPPASWPTAHISAYATAHPWEDWAETFAHYLHMIDTLETAFAFGLSATPRPAGRLTGRLARPGHDADIRFDAYRASFDTVIEAWPPLTVLMNSLNRAMGQPDSYPFVLSEPVVDKLRFIHDCVEQGADGGSVHSGSDDSRVAVHSA